MRVVSAVTISLGLAGLLAGTVPAAAAPSPSRSPFHPHQRLAWGPCSAAQKELNEAGAQCAKVTVPLDYSRPQGRTVQIAVSRIKAKSKNHRLGILLSNPGGPGGAGLANTLALRPALKDVADRYDLIGFDPRFLGESTPLTCAPARPPAPSGPSTSAREDFEASVRSARDTARRCQEPGDNAKLLPHASTRNVARDMDVIRAALGERKLSYYGVSYGADLGAVYTQMFPRRTARMVIDSSTDPAATQYELFQRSGKPAEEALDEWARWAARHHGEYRLGRTATGVRASVQRLLDQAERRPVNVAGHRLGAPVLRMLLKQPIQHEEKNPALAAIVRDLADAAADKPGEPGPELASMLQLLASPDLADSMVGGAIFMCGDGGRPAGGWPKNPETYWNNSRLSRPTQPVFGPYVNGMIAPCAFWNSRPREPGTAISNDVPVLMLQARRDNNVPYDGALALHARLTASRLVTADIRSHGVYGRGNDGLRPVPCADRAVNTYLRDGILPATDLTCPPSEATR
ncbi:alpha/beta fold hydrolase [Streptomyces sp. ISL-99]|uniref:alpha/beta hydrolase n=1 Tax=Streptomyces sp. ISL-99 TaxID=2819193 RepID=UPI001BEA38E1|nr:alpha/beta hydrolase [Streptomyces sp. ISL-99]MBT2526382.1 alpha/beta fold hydrolase [Streptomyces sp. ISL-99]